MKAKYACRVKYPLAQNKTKKTKINHMNKTYWAMSKNTNVKINLPEMIKIFLRIIDRVCVRWSWCSVFILYIGWLTFSGYFWQFFDNFLTIFRQFLFNLAVRIRNQNGFKKNGLKWSLLKFYWSYTKWHLWYFHSWLYIPFYTSFNKIIILHSSYT